MLDSKKVVTLAKTETTYGTDAVPTGADAVVTSEVQLTPFQANTVSRNLDRPGFGGDQQMHVGVHALINFNVELVGSGTLGTPPAWGRLLKACQCEEIIVAATSVRYRPDSDGTDSMTIYFNLDGQLHKLLGARGTFRLTANSQNIPVLAFTFTGLWVEPASVAALAPTGWSEFQPPRPVTFDDTPVATLHGHAGVFTTFEFDQGNDVQYFDNPGERYVGIVDRASTGNITMLAPQLTDKNWFATAKADTLGTLQVVHGTVDATKVIFAAPENTVQLLQPNYGDDRGRATLQAQLSFVPTAAQDDEWEIRLAAA